MDQKLEELIHASLVDGKITPKERKALEEKVKELGYNLDEFNIHLDAELYKMKSARRERKIAFLKEHRLAVIITSASIIFILALFFFFKYTSKGSKIKRFVKKNDLEYANFKDALINYDFENAYALASYYDEINYKKLGKPTWIKQTIVDNEINYLLSEGYVARGLEVLAENNFSMDKKNDYLLKNYDILISKKKFSEALTLIKNYSIPATDQVAIIAYNEIINKLFREVSKNRIGGFDYYSLLSLYKPITRQRYVRTESVEKKTDPTYEDVPVKNLLGKVKKDKEGNVITEKVMTDPGGQVYYDEVKVYEDYIVNEYKEKAEQILEERGITY